VLLDEAANRLHTIGFRIPGKCSRPAAQARPIPCLLGRLGRLKKMDIFPPRTPRCARWPAIDPGSRNGKEELAVALRVARQHRFPVAIFWSGSFLCSRLCERHGFQDFRCKYGIRRHSKESLRHRPEGDYPNLAVKLFSLAGVLCDFCVNFFASFAIAFSFRRTDDCQNRSKRLEFRELIFTF
jgi:hypothetical protein